MQYAADSAKSDLSSVFFGRQAIVICQTIPKYLCELVAHLEVGTQCGLRDQISRQLQPKTLTPLSMSKLPFDMPQALYRLKKIVPWNPNRPLARRANTTLLLAKGKSKTVITELLQAARSSVNRWINWYLTDDIDGLQAD